MILENLLRIVSSFTISSFHFNFRAVKQYVVFHIKVIVKIWSLQKTADYKGTRVKEKSSHPYIFYLL